MLIDFERDDPGQVWKALYGAYREGDLVSDAWHLAVRAAAHYARTVQADFGISPGGRRSKIEQIRRQVERVIKEVERGGDVRGKAVGSWYRGYFDYQIKAFASARCHYEQAYSELNQVADYLVDYGRLQYNTGWLLHAEALFEQTFQLRHELTTQPLQAYRWLAKVHRLSRRFSDEVRILEALAEEVLDEEQKPIGTDTGKGSRINQPTQELTADAAFRRDRELSRDFVLERLGRAYLDAGKCPEALAFVQTWMESGDKHARTLARQGLLALVHMKQDDKAREWAESWSQRLRDGSILVQYQRLTGRPFSASLAQIRETVREADQDDGPMTIVFYSPYSRKRAAFDGFPSRLGRLVEAAQQLFSLGFAEEGLDLLFEAAQGGLEQSNSPFVATVLLYLNRYHSVLPPLKRISALFDEAVARFPDCPYTWLQAGQRHMRLGQHEQALAAFRAADELDPSSREPLFKAFLGSAYGALGQHEAAQKHFEIAMGRAEGDEAVSAYTYALEWAVSNERHALALDWADRYLNYKMAGIKSFEGSGVIYEYGGRAALALARYHRAAQYYEWLVAYMASRFADTQENESSPFSYAAHAQANLMWALSAALSQDLETAQGRLHQARILDPANSLLPIIEAVLDVAHAQYERAVALVLEGDSEEWLLCLLGQYVLDKARQGGVACPPLTELEYRLRQSAGDVPAVSELLDRLDRQSRSLEEVREYAEETQRTYASLKRTFQAMLSALQLTEYEQRARDQLIGALRSGSHVEQAAESFVDSLIRRQLPLGEGQIRYQRRFSQEAWGRLDEPIKERFRAAEGYLTLAGKGELDLGPAVLALSSALEHLLRSRLVEPLHRHMRRDNTGMLELVTTRLSTISLGQIPRILGVDESSSPIYAEFAARWVQRCFSEAQASYILRQLPTAVLGIAQIRNEWAHGGDGVSLDTYRRMEELLLEEHRGMFVVLA